ncbi:MAG: glycine cleavage system protein H [Bacteroidia bacterium]|nr:glycine cleavage system protein H [Bacteroidia bacterium]
MNDFNYSNIFETKGIEYIAIITFFLILIPFWIILNKQKSISKKIKKVLGILSFDILKIPQGVFHNNNHTWAFLEKNGDASVGLDDFLLHTTGEVKLRTLKIPGETINKGDLITEIIKGDKLLSVASPISGVVIKTNVQLIESPELLNQDPYGKGWIFKIKPSKWKEESRYFYLSDEASRWSKMEIQRFKDFLAQIGQKYSDEPSLAILQDGGELIDNTLSELPDVVWQDFQKSFLNENKFNNNDPVYCVLS